ncbi:hypothetical protein Zmor_008165 [Zophobas morio]|uniref:Uncharacterized protein n=1 Tax=Zophobas morio TaxID=2755281 RepID=A0AA38MQ37_9CUCU|nr:hypothetical protein Zmor_008165 [Zophobas morio]
MLTCAVFLRAPLLNKKCFTGNRSWRQAKEAGSTDRTPTRLISHHQDETVDPQPTRKQKSARDLNPRNPTDCAETPKFFHNMRLLTDLSSHRKRKENKYCDIRKSHYSTITFS